MEMRCENCGNLGAPDCHGKCASCGSDAVADVIDPQPIRYREPKAITGIERMAMGGPRNHEN